jgi:hypothetical protein
MIGKEKQTFMAFGLFLVVFVVFSSGCFQTQPQQNAGMLQLTVKINNGTHITTENTQIANGSTAFDAFKKVATLNYSTHPTYGVFITGVNGLEQDAAKGMYWQYYVNGQLAPVGVGAYILDKNATLEFRYEKPPAF